MFTSSKFTQPVLVQITPKTPLACRYERIIHQQVNGDADPWLSVLPDSWGCSRVVQGPTAARILEYWDASTGMPSPLTLSGPLPSAMWKLSILT